MSQAFESVDKQHCLAVRSDKSAGKLDKVQTGKVQPKQQTWRIKNIWLPPQLALPESCFKKKQQKKKRQRFKALRVRNPVLRTQSSTPDTSCDLFIEFFW